MAHIKGQASHQIVRWQIDGMTRVRVSVNIAPRHFDDPELIDRTDLPFVTIDNADSRDLDQALGLPACPAGHVHPAGVTVPAVDDGGDVKVGDPVVEGAQVQGTLVAPVRARKITVFKMKRRKGYRRTQGHRQNLLRVKIDDIKG